MTRQLYKNVFVLSKKYFDRTKTFLFYTLRAKCFSYSVFEFNSPKSYCIVRLFVCLYNASVWYSTLKAKYVLLRFLNPFILLKVSSILYSYFNIILYTIHVLYTENCGNRQKSSLKKSFRKKVLIFRTKKVCGKKSCKLR